MRAWPGPGTRCCGSALAAPHYTITARLAPASGTLDAAARIVLPAGETVALRIDGAHRIESMQLDGRPLSAARDGGQWRIELAAATRDRQLELRWQIRAQAPDSWRWGRESAALGPCATPTARRRPSAGPSRVSSYGVTPCSSLPRSNPQQGAWRPAGVAADGASSFPKDRSVRNIGPKPVADSFLTCGDAAGCFAPGRTDSRRRVR